MSTKITAELVKELRDATGVSVMQCKVALEEAEGDKEKALIILKKKSSSIAMKKSDRTASDGLIVAMEGAGKVVLLTLHSETDFVAKNEEFVQLANTLTKMAMDSGVESMQAASADMINPLIQKIGEKIELGKVEEIAGGTLGVYVHNGKSAVVTVLEGGEASLAKDIAMHIAAMKPAYVQASDITDEEKQKVMEVFEREVAESDKPEEIKKKMLEGKINTYFKEQTLMDQPFIKNPDLTVGRLLTEKKAKLIKFVKESIG
ncbi:MAG: translation elongation factor Ts [bacterium]